MSFYIATTGAGQLLRVEGFALVSRDEEVLRSISDLRSIHAHCIASPLRTSVAIPLPVNRDALLVHPLQLALDQYDLQWEYIPAHLLSPRDRDTVRLAGTQLYITLDAPQPATLERRLDMLGNETRELIHMNSLDPARRAQLHGVLTMETLRNMQRLMSGYGAEASSVLGDAFLQSLLDTPHAGPVEVKTENKKGRAIKAPEPARDLRARKVRIRK